MNHLEALLANTTNIYQARGRFYHSDMRAYAELMCDYPIQAKAVFSPHIYAINFPFRPKTNKGIVVFYDTQNKNILYIHTKAVDHPLYFRSTDLPANNNPVSNSDLLDMIGNRLLPNMASNLTNQILTAITEHVKGHVCVIPSTIIELIRSTPEHPITLGSTYPRMNDPIMDQLRLLFIQYNVQDSLPSDIVWNKEKTWVYVGTSPNYPGRYIEIEIRHAMRRNDPGMEIRVLLPGFARRILNYGELLAA